MEEVLDILAAGWSIGTGLIDPYVDLRTFLVSAAGLLFAGWGFNGVKNVYLKLLLALVFSACVFGLFMSVFAVPDAFALFAGLLAFSACIFGSWGNAKSTLSKVLVGVLFLGVGGATLYVASAGLPNIDLGDGVSEVLSLVGEFLGRTADAAQEGADMVG